MKKLLTTIFTLLLLSGCETGLDGKDIIGYEGSRAWWNNAPWPDRIHYFRNYEIYQLCSSWDRFYDQRNITNIIRRSTISKVLINRGEDPMLCRDPISDKVNITHDKAQDAERRAREAESKAIDAERRAREAERRAREAERKANDY